MRILFYLEIQQNKSKRGGKEDFLKRSDVFIIRAAVLARLAVVFTTTVVEGLSRHLKSFCTYRLLPAPLAAFPPDALIFKVPKSVFQTSKIDRFSEFAKGYLILKSHLWLQTPSL